MADPREKRARRSQRLRERALALLRFLGGSAHRIYALALMGLIVWLSFLAIRYLFVSIARPSATPPQIADLPRRMDGGLVQESRPDWLGLKAVDNPRSPPARYHRFTPWLAADTHNDCVRSGCHGPLPHERSKELRAFLNMHATSVHCGVCHIQSEETPLPLVWYGLSDGQPRGAPAVLRAYASLEPVEAATRVADRRRAELSDLIDVALREIGGDRAVEQVLRKIHLARAESEALTRALLDARELLQQMFRVEYAARLAVRDDRGRPVLRHPGTEHAVAAWFDRGSKLEGELREAALRAVHPLRRETPLHCDACHRSSGADDRAGDGLVDFAALGYPAARIRSLHESFVFDMIQHIGEGRPFHLPGVGVEGERPAMMPASRDGDK